MKHPKQDVARAKTRLAEHLKPGSTVYTLVMSVARSGMSRTMRLFMPGNNGGDPVIDITGDVACILGNPQNEQGHMRIGGCGMDMGFSAVYTLSHYLYPEGFRCMGKGSRCPSNDHSNGRPRHKGWKHTDGGYALRQRWM